VVKGLAGSVAAGVAALLGRSGADARRVTQAQCGNEVCADDPTVCNEGCVCCVFGNGNSRCMPPSSCQRYEGVIESNCSDGQVEINGACFTPCADNDGSCPCECDTVLTDEIEAIDACYTIPPSTGGDCESSAGCPSGQACTFHGICAVPCGSFTCSSSDDCASGKECIDKICQYPSNLTQAPEVVWRALTDGKALSSWAMENDFAPVVGHRFTLRTTPRAGFDGVMSGQVVAVEPNRRLSFTWSGGALTTPTTVTITLKPNGSGTRLLLHHSSPDDSPCRAASELLGNRWAEQYLNRALSKHLTQG
jgi:uncharacterized protein YndB with AHSA1/START domain